MVGVEKMYDVTYNVWMQKGREHSYLFWQIIVDQCTSRKYLEIISTLDYSVVKES